MPSVRAYCYTHIGASSNKPVTTKRGRSARNRVYRLVVPKLPRILLSLREVAKRRDEQRPDIPAERIVVACPSPRKKVGQHVYFTPSVSDERIAQRWVTTDEAAPQGSLPAALAVSLRARWRSSRARARTKA